MKQSENFPKAIAQYIIQTPCKKMDGDGFVLLNSMFFDTDFKAVTSKKFVTKLIDSLCVILDDEIFSAIVWIVTMIGLDLQNEGKDNYVFKECASNENSDYFKEIFLVRFNKAGDKDLSNYVDFLTGMLAYLKSLPKPKQFFHRNDLNCLIDNIIREFKNNPKLDIKTTYMRLLY